MPEFEFSSSFSLFFLFVAVLVAVMISIAHYRRTNPPVPPRLRALLTLLRASALAFMCLLLGEPILSFLNRNTLPPTTVILLDNSRSMTISDRTGSRSDQLLSALDRADIRQLTEGGDIRFMTIGAKPGILDSFHPDSLRFDANETNISLALKAAVQMTHSDNITSVVLLSDGNDTGPGSPLFDPEVLTLPVFAVAIGDTAEQRDVLIRKITTNSVVHAGMRIPVHVQIKSSGSAGEHVKISLKKESSLLDQKELILDSGTREYQVALAYTPTEAGIQRYSVEVSSVPGELTIRNNRASFSAKVIDRKAGVLIIAGSPSPDLAFVRRILEADSALRVTVQVESRSEFAARTPDPALVAGSDCIVLIGFPTTRSDRSLLQEIRMAATQRSGLLFIPSRSLDQDALAELGPVLPFTVGRFSDTEISVFLHPVGHPLDPLLKLPADFPDEPWSTLPPVFTLDSRFMAKPESDVHAVRRIRTTITTEPFLLSRNINKARSVAFLAYGLWRWNMLADRSPADILDHVVANSIRWLTTREEDRRIRVAPLKEIFTEGEAVEFEAQVYNETLSPLEDAHVQIEASSGRNRFDLVLTPLGSGQFEGQLSGVPQGDYTFVAEVVVEGNTLGRIEGTFTVGESNAEFLETRTNAQFLRQLAARSGGAYYTPDRLSTLASDVRSLPSFRTREIVKSSEFRFWNHSLSLFAALFLFALEWVIRKRSGML
ncbi:MAG: VWA domain-containing protein [Ignavibacteriales bacterium]|nr:VWA domain-containing protein [Ignavibacteriales bacterium]